MSKSSFASFCFGSMNCFSAQRNTTLAFTDCPYSFPNVEYIITTFFLSSPFGLAFQFR